jgi:hypothetical protein
MDIRFSDGPAGVDEARAVQAMLANVPEDADAPLMRLRERLALAAAAHLHGVRADEAQAPGFWRNLFGPSKRELELALQRSAALERAERAERSSFESLAETARIARERDDARTRIAQLEQEVAELRAG